MPSDRGYVLTNPQGADRITLANLQVLRTLIRDVAALQAGGVGSGSAEAAPTTHEELLDMPSKTNVDHDERYVVATGATAPEDPIPGKLWYDPAGATAPVIELSQAQMLIRGFLRC